jgi:PPK2 family polyphosphate:nucleotide phosphotransferase
MIKLANIPTNSEKKVDKDQIKAENKLLAKKIGQLQNLLIASEKKALLVIYQGMDASGKDGAVKDVFEDSIPSGIQVHSFKKPTEVELAHDFLWRVHRVCPKKGMIHVFNRSHYEDILVPTVEGFLPKELLSSRYDSINNFEKMLTSEGTVILKFYLHISKERQKERLIERIELVEKNWKHNDGDWDTREKWEEYMSVYETIFEKCNAIPWHIIPADSNSIKVNKISKIIIKTLEDLNLEYPELQSDRF